MALREMTAEVLDRFYGSGVWQRHTLAELVEEHARRRPDAVAVMDQHERLTYRQLIDRSRAIAAWLIEQGLTPGEVVAVQSANRLHLPLVHLACNLAGLTFLPLTQTWREREVGHLLRLSRARVIVVPDAIDGFDYVAMMSAIRQDLPDLRLVGTPEPGGADFDLAAVILESPDTSALDSPRHGPDDPRFVMVTSGTTELPRMSEWTDNNLWFFMREYIDAVQLGEDDIALGLAPAGTGATGYVYPVIAPLLVGATSGLLEHWSTAEAFDVLAKEQITIATAVPTQLVKMLQDPAAASADLSALRVITNAGAALPATTGPEVQRVFDCTLQTCYGASDGGVPVLTRIPHTDHQRFRTVGQILPESEIRLLVPGQDELVDVAPGEVGEIAWRGPTKHLGYLNEPERTAAAFVGDGWYRSGDLGAMDEDGFLSIVGRVKDVIIRGGQNISPREIEDLVIGHPDVVNVAVIGIPDAVYGERICACVTLRDGAEPLTLEVLLADLERRGIAKSKWPERVETFDVLPESGGGKTSKVELRRLVGDRD